MNKKDMNNYISNLKEDFKEDKISEAKMTWLIIISCATCINIAMTVSVLSVVENIKGLLLMISFISNFIFIIITYKVLKKKINEFKERMELI